MTKLPKPPNRSKIDFVSDYYKKISIFENSKLIATVEDDLFKWLRNTKVTKAAGIDQISKKFLKDGERILAKPISELSYLSMACT